MSEIELTVIKREATGKAGSQELTEHDVKGVVYGKGIGPIPVRVDYNKFRKAYTEAGTSQIIALNIEGEKAQDVLFKDIQMASSGNKVQHFDMYAVRKGEKLQTEVPVELIGEAPGLTNDTTVTTAVEQVTIEAIPSKIPEHLEVSIDSLQEVGDTVTVADIDAVDDVIILADVDEVIAKLDVVKIQEIEEPEEEVSAADVESEHGSADEGEDSTEATEEAAAK